jgi:excinuclease ABC subunit B
VSETNRRREIQQAFNREHGITPRTVTKTITSIRESIWEQDYVTVPTDAEMVGDGPPAQVARTVERLRREMREAAKALEFERAADLRDRIRVLETQRLRLG